MLTGPLVVRLWISSNCPDTDFTAKLIDVYPPNEDHPDGFAMNLTDGIIRCRYRDSREHPSLMEPGRTYEVAIEAFPTSNLFKAGHRIRLDVSSSHYPHFDLNFNTGEPEGLATRSRVATNTVWMDPMARRRGLDVLGPGCVALSWPGQRRGPRFDVKRRDFRPLSATSLPPRHRG